METKIKTIDIHAREWFDRINGNRYFSGSVTTDIGTKKEKIWVIPFQYGNNDQYKYKAIRILFELKFIPTERIFELENKEKIIIRANIQKGCKKKEVKFNPLSTN